MATRLKIFFFNFAKFYKQKWIMFSMKRSELMNDSYVCQDIRYGKMQREQL